MVSELSTVMCNGDDAPVLPVDPWVTVLPGGYAAGTAGAIIGNNLNARVSTLVPADPWATPLPGSYASGTAGAIVGNNLDARVSTRSTFAGGPVAGVNGPVVGINNDKTGYALVSRTRCDHSRIGC